MNRLVIEDVKWKPYDNVIQKRAYSVPGKPPKITAKPSLSINKKRTHTLRVSETQENSDIHCLQLDKLNEILKRSPYLVNGKKIIINHDNARPHTAAVTCKKITDLTGKFSHTRLTPRPGTIWFSPISVSAKFLNWENCKNKTAFVLQAFYKME